jgi:hypothetical protein
MENKKTGRKPFSIELLVERKIFPENWKEVVLDLGRQGKNKLDYAVELGIGRRTLYSLMDRSEEFRNTINKALELSEKWFIDVAVKKWGEDGARGLNTQFMKYYLYNVYRDSEWKEVEQHIDLTSKGDKINDNKIEIEIIRPKIEEEEDESEIQE